MALPKLNEAIKYDIVVPSTKKTVTYRPYLVKEEKVLLQAFEAKDEKTAMRAMVDTVVACVYETLNPQMLTTFDVEYLFVHIRAKSVGETSVLSGSCLSEECEAYTDVTIDITQSEVKQEKVLDNLIELTPEISLELKYPSYVSFLKNYKEGISESKFGLLMIEECVLSVNTPDERITEWTKKEITDFIDSMTTRQFEKVGEYLSSSPTLQQEVEWSCVSCGHENKKKLEGLSDFF
jgi:hypothetical protein